MAIQKFIAGSHITYLIVKYRTNQWVVWLKAYKNNFYFNQTVSGNTLSQFVYVKTKVWVYPEPLHQNIKSLQEQLSPKMDGIEKADEPIVTIIINRSNSSPLSQMSQKLKEGDIVKTKTNPNLSHKTNQINKRERWSESRWLILWTTLFVGHWSLPAISLTLWTRDDFNLLMDEGGEAKQQKQK